MRRILRSSLIDRRKLQIKITLAKNTEQTDTSGDQWGELTASAVESDERRERLLLLLLSEPREQRKAGNSSQKVVYCLPANHASTLIGLKSLLFSLRDSGLKRSAKTVFESAAAPSESVCTWITVEGSFGTGSSGGVSFADTAFLQRKMHEERG